MIEKLKSAIIQKSEPVSKTSLQYQNPSSSVPTQEIRQIYPYENKSKFAESSLSNNATNLPKRETNGLTLRHSVGVFPRQVSLEIRHTHPSLGLNEVAHQRQQHSQEIGLDNYRNNFNTNPHFQQQQQCYYQNQSAAKGVLSLGLPPNMLPKSLSGNTFKRPSSQSATSETIHHYYETLSPKYANIVSIHQQRNKV